MPLKRNPRNAIGSVFRHWSERACQRQIRFFLIEWTFAGTKPRGTVRFIYHELLNIPTVAFFVASAGHLSVLRTRPSTRDYFPYLVKPHILQR